MGGFEKKSGNLTKFEKTSDFVSSNLQNSLFSKPSNVKNFIKILLSQTKIRKFY